MPNISFVFRSRQKRFNKIYKIKEKNFVIYLGGPNLKKNFNKKYKYILYVGDRRDTKILKILLKLLASRNFLFKIIKLFVMVVVNSVIVK